VLTKTRKKRREKNRKSENGPEIKLIEGPLA
jgi:hypothetical protein